jgi:hypothetical protein
LIPLVIIFAIAIASLVVARRVMVPESFGKYGHYRADAVDDVMNLGIVYAGFEVCADCHDEIVETKEQSRHSGVSCEVCHGPAADHAEAPDEFIPDAPRGRDACTLCHGYNPARPSGFPQIIARKHNPGKPCMSCHEPHDPHTPNTPEECSACHREIANTKDLSHHASLECIQCHTVPERHKVEPRLARPSKPEERSFCGGCHAEDANSEARIPRIDVETHEPRYTCWDCHYPHHPEAY